MCYVGLSPVPKEQEQKSQYPPTDTEQYPIHLWTSVQSKDKEGADEEHCPVHWEI